ncbi:dihydrolipoyl dehydrogenase [Marinicella litoralis]|uniref:Dihydrolipoyl dehydrogenase n=1 Tax=Marinicella litoralis TaxID=644220 RepID=A0A4R6XS31_9GAMM|nr:dihydrolipoyl dehydrogenase [Marinicella litoralis]TDR22566.1 dihydrolipoamide dehydrogenase [Marinicella litoralis]
MEKYDVVVIGGGPAGYVAAIRAAQMGFNTLCVDRFKGKDGKYSLGGTCLNVGCIPSKALLDSSKHFDHMNHSYDVHGISFDNPKMDVATMIARKDKIVKQLTGGIAQLFKANKVKYIGGSGKLLKDRQVEINNDEGSQVVQGEHIILASGSVPISIPNVEIDNEYILDNAGALDINAVPEKLGVIGGGVIGLELGSVWNRLGSKVKVFEAMDTFLAACDQGIAKMAARTFKKQGLDIHLSTFVKSATIKDGKVEVVSETNGEKTTEIFDKLLVAVGRKAETDGLLADDCGIKLTERGQIDVNDDCQTSVPNVWAIGDAVRGPMLAHKGSEEGSAVAERIAGQHGHVDFNTVPFVIYTEPELAWVGKTEEQLKEAGIDYKVGSFPMAANGRALAMNEPTGMVKILADAETDELLGAHIFSANAADLLSECVVTMEFKGCAEDLSRIIHAHPTLSEAVFEAAMNVDKRAIHKAN